MSLSRPSRSYPHILAVERLDIEGLRLLRLMRVLVGGIHFQIAHELALQRPAAEHALHRLHHDALRELALEDLSRRALLDASGIAGVPLIELVVGLPAREDGLVSVDHDYVIAQVDVRRV